MKRYKAYMKDAARKLKRINMLKYGTIVIGVLLSIVLISLSSYEIRKQCTSYMVSGIESGRKKFEDNQDKADIYTETNQKMMVDLANYSAFYYENQGFSKTSQNKLRHDINCAYFHFYNGTLNDSTMTADGKVIPDADQMRFKDIPRDALYQILKNGEGKIDGYHYTSAPVVIDRVRGYSILQWREESVLKEEEIFSGYSSVQNEVIVCIDTNQNRIVESTDTILNGTSSEDIFYQEQLHELTINQPTTIMLKNGKKALAIADEVKDGHLFVGFITYDRIVPDTLKGIVIPISLGWIFLVIILFYMIHFYKKDVSNSEYVKVFKVFHVNYKLMSHVSALIIMSIILINVSFSYIETLIDFGNHNVEATKSLQALDESLKITQENDENFKKDCVDCQGILLNALNTYFMNNPEKVTSIYMDTLVNKMPNTEAIAVFDGTATAIIDTEGHVGYTLSRDENASENVCQAVLSGYKNVESYSQKDAESIYYVIRRQDAAGLIRIKQSANYYEQFHQMSTIENVFSGANVGLTTKAYIVEGERQWIQWFDSEKELFEQRNNTLSEEAMKNGFSGFAKIDGEQYYIFTRNTDDSQYILVSADVFFDPNERYHLFVMLIVIAAFVAQYVLFLCVDHEKKTEEELLDINLDRKMILENIDHTSMDDRFRRTVSRMAVITGIVIVGLLFLDLAISKASLLDYLFSSQWSKGFNLFSITMIIILAVLASVIGILISKLIIIFTQNMGPRGITIGSMLVSMTKFAILIIVVVSILIDLGFNSSTLLAGAGILGAMISFCAQQTVNDLLSGFFIVFDGSFNIGDWVMIDGFRGQVQEIGIRVTRVAYGGEVQIYNNSSLRNVRIMAGGGTGAQCLVDIDYREDIQKVFSLINDNKERYQQAIPELIDGPFVDGVMELAESGIVIRIWGKVEQKDALRVEREMRRVTKELFSENDIQIPYNQLVIHKADEL